MTMVLIAEKFFIHLVGKTGTGKSSTGNSFIGRKAFSCISSPSAVTTDIQIEAGRLGLRDVSVVDGPGLVGVNTGVLKSSIQEFKRVVELNQDTVHVFLIIWRYGDPLTPDDADMVAAMKKEFGPSVFRNHGIVVMTCGDNFRADTEDCDDITFESWCKSQTGTFAHVLKECEGRVVLIENSKPAAKGGDREALYCLEKLIVQLDNNSATGRGLVKRASKNQSGTITELLCRYKVSMTCIGLAFLCFCFWKLQLRSYFS